MGGVVNSHLRVYRTSNVRVFDASIYRLQLSGHPTANLWGIAEWVFHMVKEDSAPGHAL